MNKCIDIEAHLGFVCGNLNAIYSLGGVENLVVAIEHSSVKECQEITVNELIEIIITLDKSVTNLNNKLNYLTLDYQQCVENNNNLVRKLITRTKNDFISG